MCNVCVAMNVIDAMEGGKPFYTHHWAGSPFNLDVWTDAKEPEFVTGTLRIRCVPEDGFGRLDHDSAWSEDIATPDLAGSLSALGADTRWEHVSDAVKAWLAGGDIQPVLERFTRPAPVAKKAKLKLKTGAFWKKRKQDAEARMQRVLALDAFTASAYPWTVTPSRSRFVRATRADGRFSFLLRFWHARGSVRKTWLEVDRPFRLNGPAEVVGPLLLLWERACGERSG